MNEHIDMKISGSSTMPGGEYGSVSISGAGKVNGSLKCEELHCSGAAKVQGDVDCAGELHTSGAGKIAGSVHCGSLSASGDFSAQSVQVEGLASVSGSLRTEQALTADELSASGSLEAGSIHCRAFRASGSCRVRGDLEAETAVLSGAAEIGRLDYIKRTGHELTCDSVDAKTDYAAQGQSILMEQYRHFVRPEYSVRQVLVEHQHFNDPEKREHIRKLFLRAKEQGAIPIVNYNDPVSDEENRKWELSNLRREHREVHECVDNDETAAVIAGLVTARTLLIMTSTEGIYADPKDPKTLIRDVEARTPEEMESKIRELQTYCMGASRAGANGAHAKLEYALGPAMRGTTVIIGHGRHRISDLLEGRVACTRIGLA